MNSSPSPSAVFERHGLASTGFWGTAKVPSSYDGDAIPGRGLREALEELGGLYIAFGRFLRWRADLLNTFWITNLRDLRPVFNPIPAYAVAETIVRELGRVGDELSENIEPSPAWTSIRRTGYRSTYNGRPVYMEVARAAIREADLAAFEKCIRGLSLVDFKMAVAPETLLQFRQWLRVGEDINRQRSFLEVLGRHDGETIAGYPKLIPELSSASLLCWHATAGIPIEQLLAKGDPEAAMLVASAILEQFYTLSMVDADLDLSSMVVDENYRLHFVRLNHSLPVIPSLINSGMKYIGAVLAGDATLSAQTLVRLVFPHPPLDFEKRLMEEFSGIEPELKVNLWYPSTAAALESNWRALAKLSPTRPLFVDCLHRNLIASGYWNGDAARAGAPRADAIYEAQSPIVGRLMKTQMSQMMNRDSANEFAIGSGLLAFGAMREMNRLLEEMRENDLTIGVEPVEPVRYANSPGQTSPGWVLGVLFALLLASLRWGAIAPEPWAMLLKVLAVGTLPAMFWAISRIR